MKTVMAFWGMERSYYSFDSGANHFVVLDANYLQLDGKYEDYACGNYHKLPDAINNLTPEQLEWLKADLAATDRTTVISAIKIWSPITCLRTRARSRSKERNRASSGRRPRARK